MKTTTPFITLLIILILQCFSSSAENNKSKFSEDLRGRHKRFHKSSYIIKENLKSEILYKYKIDSLIEIDQTGNEDHMKFVFTAGENNLIEEEVEFLWDKESKSWYKDYGYTYEKDGNILTDYYWYWDNSNQKWINDYACVSEYNENGLIEEKGYYKWNTEKESWDNDYYDIISYRDDGEILLWIEYKWSVESSEWITYGKWEYAYENNNLKKLTGYYTKDDGSFYIYDEEVFTYDTGNSFAESTYRVWSDETKQLEKDSKYVCTWNKDVVYEEIILPYYYLKHRNRYMILEETEYTWDAAKQDWKKTLINNFYYSGITTNNDEIGVKESVKAYPNPVSDIISFENLKEGSSIDLYSVDGKKVKSLHVFSGQKHAMSELSSGIYFIRISNKDKVQLLKVIKK